METKNGLTQYDAQCAWRCPRLGDTVPFRYCRTVNDGLPCPTILTCWQDRFNIQGFLQAHYSAEDLGKVFDQVRPAKASQLVDLIRKARQE